MEINIWSSEYNEDRLNDVSQCRFVNILTLSTRCVAAYILIRINYSELHLENIFTDDKHVSIQNN